MEQDEENRGGKIRRKGRTGRKRVKRKKRYGKIGERKRGKEGRGKGEEEIDKKKEGKKEV